MPLPLPSLSLYTIRNISCEKWQNVCKIWIPFKCTVKTKDKTSKFLLQKKKSLTFMRNMGSLDINIIYETTEILPELKPEQKFHTTI